MGVKASPPLSFVALILDANGTFTPICEPTWRRDQRSTGISSPLTLDEKRRRALLGPLAGELSSFNVRIPLPRPLDAIPEVAVPLMRAVSHRLAEKDATAAEVGRALLDLYYALRTATRLH